MSSASVWFTWVGLISLTLILLRQTNLVLVGSLGAACAIVLLSGRAGAPRPWRRWALLVIGPAALGAIVWQVHVWAARIGPDIAPRPLAEWNWAAPLIVLRAFFLDRLLDNELVGGAALIFVVAAIIGVALVWRRFARDDRKDDLPAPRIVVPVTAIVCFGYVVFLAWAYIAVFSDVEVAAAASLWRYLSELGPLLIAAGLCILLQLAPRRTPRPNSMIATAGIATAALMLLPSVGRGYYRLDCRFRDVAAARGAIAELRPALSSFANAPTRPARVAVVNATMGDWMAYALAFDMHWPASGSVVRFRTRNEPLAATEAWAWVQGLDAVLNLVPLDRAALRAEATIPPLSLLGRPAAKGDPWTMLATTQPHGFPACRVWSR